MEQPGARLPQVLRSAGSAQAPAHPAPQPTEGGGQPWTSHPSPAGRGEGGRSPGAASPQLQKAPRRSAGAGPTSSGTGRAWSPRRRGGAGVPLAPPPLPFLAGRGCPGDWSAPGAAGRLLSTPPSRPGPLCAGAAPGCGEGAEQRTECSGTGGRQAPRAAPSPS